MKMGIDETNSEELSKKHWKKYLALRIKEEKEEPDLPDYTRELKQETEPEEYIQIQVLLNTSESGRVLLQVLDRLKVTRRLKPFKKRVADFLNTPVEELVFVYGDVILDNQTPRSLSLKDDDTVYVLWKKKFEKERFHRGKTRYWMRNRYSEYSLLKLFVDTSTHILHAKSFVLYRDFNFRINLSSIRRKEMRLR